MDNKEFWSRFKDVRAGPRSTGAMFSSDNLAAEIGPEKLPFYAHKMNVPPEVFDNINGVLNGYRPVQENIRKKTLDIIESMEYLNANGKKPVIEVLKNGLDMSPLKLKFEGGAGRTNPFRDFIDKWNASTHSTPASSIPGATSSPGTSAAAPAASSGTTKPVDTNKLLATFYSDPILSPSNEALTATDRIIFIAMTFVLRAVALYIVEWAVNTYMVKSFQNAFKLYLICYLSLFTLWVVMVNSSNKLFLKMLFYYISTDPHGLGRILVHVFIQLMILPVPLIVKTKGFEYTQEEYTYEQRRKTMSILNNFTFFIWAITSIIATQY